MLLLAVDTSTPAITAAVSDGRASLGEGIERGAALHGELLAVVVKQALARANARPADLTGVVVGVGPGPFTGLRVGITFGSVMAAALGIPVWGVCSLDSVAARVGAADAGVVTDARRKEVYFAEYRGGSRVGEPQVGKPDVAAQALAGLPIFGTGASLYPDIFGRQPFDAHSESPDAGWLARLAARVLDESADSDSLPAGLLAPLPLYLRRPDAVEAAARKRVTP